MRRLYQTVPPSYTWHTNYKAVRHVVLQYGKITGILFMDQLKGVILSGMPASGKSTVRDQIVSLAREDRRTPVVLKDRFFVQQSLLKWNDDRAGIPEVFIPGLGTEYFLPSEGEVPLTHGSLFLTNDVITHFSLKTPSAFHHGRRTMLNSVDRYPDPFGNLFFVIEWGTANNVRLKNGSTMYHDSVDLYEAMEHRKLSGKLLTERLAVVEVYTTNDEERTQRNLTREDRLSPEIWKFYEKNGGWMPPELQEKLLFVRIVNDGTVDALQRDTANVYEIMQEKYKQSIEGGISLHRERLR